MTGVLRLLLLLVLLAAHAAAAPRDRLAIGLGQTPASLHPDLEASVAGHFVAAMAFRPLTAYDHDWQLACFLCTELPSFANGRVTLTDRPDGSHGLDVRVTLRPDARWGDGVPVTSADIAFAWEVGRDPQSGYPDHHSYERVERVEVVDDKTVILHMAQAEYDFANLFSPLPAHLEGPIFHALASPADYPKQTLYSRAPTTPGLWNGPYRITQEQPGGFVVLEPNAHWGGKPPAFKQISVKWIENTAALSANLLSGDIDYVAGEAGLTVDQGLTYAKSHADRFDVSFPPSLVYQHLDVNLDSPVLADKRVRQALLLAIDRPTLAQQLSGGHWVVADSWVNPRDPGFDPAVTRYPFDPDRAAALLDAAGFKPGPDGIRVDGSGRRLSFAIAGGAGVQLVELIEQVLQSEWRQIGVEAVIKNDTASELFGETLRKRSFDTALFSWVSSPDVPPTTLLGSDHVPSAANNWGGQNYPDFRDAEMDRLIASARLELDAAKRKPIWARMQQIWTDALPELPLFFRADVFAVPKWLKGIRPTGHQSPTTLWVEDWHAE